MRKVAATILCKVLKHGQSLSVALDHSLVTFESKKDRAFIQALCFGVLRHFHKLEFILQQLLSKPLRSKDIDIQVLLLSGIYQLRYMRVKPHAAVSETVSACNKSWAKSLLNAILRQYIREQDTLEKMADENCIAHFSHPQWMIDQIENNWPELSKNIFLENNRQPPMALRVNLAQIDRNAYLRLLSENSIVAKLVNLPASAVLLDKPTAVENLPGFKQGLISVQDIAAQLAAEILDVEAGQSVLDLCAAPGGKTAAILERQAGQVSMLAVDIDKARLVKVEENLQRLQLSAELMVGDATKVSEWINNKSFDRILVDAPCSALGVIRRHPDIKILRRESDIPALQELQQRILQQAWKLLTPGGILVYATCSILKQENEQQISQFLQSHKDADEIVINGNWGVKRPFGRQILTGEQGMDGFYYAKLAKKPL